MRRTSSPSFSAVGANALLGKGAAAFVGCAYDFLRSTRQVSHDMSSINITEGRAHFPWPSALALLYPVAAMIYVATATPAPPLMIVGYGVAQLGYVLFAAAVWRGTFRVLALTKRWHVVVSGIAAFSVGTLLSNVGG